MDEPVGALGQCVDKRHAQLAEKAPELRSGTLPVWWWNLGSDAYAATPAPVRGWSTTIAVFPERIAARAS